MKSELTQQLEAVNDYGRKLGLIQAQTILENAIKNIPIQGSPRASVISLENIKREIAKIR